MRWYTRMERRACFHEITGFIVGKRLKNSTLTLRRFQVTSLEPHEESMVKRKRAMIPIGQAGASKTPARAIELGRESGRESNSQARAGRHTAVWGG